ncbi:S-adenosyl-L-methionine-dependent methyltransferase [Echria macrotheca]|uniref:type I protein arginine methyltransferase n=1 Tax=Echria macrotheca TaxID=438768 RepID=A0AAJ0BMQ6_9PEZI|nr:S-adenosyl-L-methionine-dependent methyltransferase [Echria macrotheca]
MSESYPHSTSSASSSGDSDGWVDADHGNGEDSSDESPVIISLVDDRVFTDAAAMLDYCRDKTGLDFLGVRDRLGLDFHGMVKLINFVRQRVHEGKEVPKDITQADLADDSLLKPVLEDDALILCLDDLPQTASPDKQESSPQVDDLLKKNAELQAELENLTKQFSNYREAVQKTLDDRWQANDEPEDAPPQKTKEKDDYYFESYAYNDIHETMLKDKVRTDAYRDFIYDNKDLFAGKTVLDIGCGTGILSMFCAKAGAARVIAVDRSDILDKARENVFQNKLDKVITCLKGRIEDVTLPVAQVDIIVSEWMGYALLYEAMLPSVLYARDRYLAPNGLLVPSHANMWIAPVSDSEYIADHVTFWRDVYGFDMRAMQDSIYADARAVTLPSRSVCGEPCMFRFLDLHTVRTEDLVFSAPWTSKVAAVTTASEKNSLVDGFLVWFDMFFARSRVEPSIKEDSTALGWCQEDKERRVGFTTGPFSTETHWRQVLFLVDKQTKKMCTLGDAEGQNVGGVIEYVTAEGHARGLNIKISWAVGEGEKQDQMWLLH